MLLKKFQLIANGFFEIFAGILGIHACNAFGFSHQRNSVGRKTEPGPEEVTLPVHHHFKQWVFDAPALFFFTFLCEDRHLFKSEIIQDFAQNADIVSK